MEVREDAQPSSQHAEGALPPCMGAELRRKMCPSNRESRDNALLSAEIETYLKVRCWMRTAWLKPQMSMRSPQGTLQCFGEKEHWGENPQDISSSGADKRSACRGDWGGCWGCEKPQEGGITEAKGKGLKGRVPGIHDCKTNYPKLIGLNNTLWQVCGPGVLAGLGWAMPGTTWHRPRYWVVFTSGWMCRGCNTASFTCLPPRRWGQKMVGLGGLCQVECPHTGFQHVMWPQGQSKGAALSDSWFVILFSKEAIFSCKMKTWDSLYKNKTQGNVSLKVKNVCIL